MPPPDYTNFDPNERDRKILDNFIQAKTKLYKNAYDLRLWKAFKQDFKDWTVDNFQTASVLEVGHLVDLLQTNGVFISNNKGDKEAENLYAIITAEKAHEWTEKEVIDHLKQGDDLNSKDLNKRFEASITMHGQLPNYSTNTAQNQSIQIIETPATPSPTATGTIGPITRSKSQQAHLFTPASTRRGLLPFTLQTPDHQAPTAPEPSTPGQQDSNRSYFGPPPQAVSQALVQLAKMYSDDTRYGGNEDSFESKLQIFHDYCQRVSLPETKNAYKLAFPTMLKGQALDYYYANKEIWEYGGRDPVEGIRQYFEGPEFQRAMQYKWSRTTLQSTIDDNPDKPLTECLELMLQTFQKLFHCLEPGLQTPAYYRNTLIEATRMHPACRFATVKPSNEIPGLIQDLRSDVRQYEDMRKAPTQHHVAPLGANALFTDRRYYSPRSRSPYRSRSPCRAPNHRSQKKCFVCRKPGCWSTRHTPEEREASKRRFLGRYEKRVDQLIADYEGTESDNELPEELASAVDNLLLTDSYEFEPTKDASDGASILFANTFFTTDNNNNMNYGPSIAMELANRSTAHFIASLFPNVVSNKAQEAATQDTCPEPDLTFVSESRYSSENFIGILIDSGAAKFSTAGYGQYLAYKKLARNINMDTTTAGSVTVQFGAGDPFPSLGSIDVNTPIGTVRFHVVEAMTPFLMSLNDLDRLKAYFDNTRNMLVGPNATAPIVRRFGHPFLVWEYAYHTFLIESFENNPCFLTDVELRRLHRRFGHPSTERLRRLLTRAGHEADKEAIEHIRRFCHHCQIYGKSPGRFRFTIHDDVNFNHSIIVDIMHIDGKPVLHIVDEATRFNAAHWLANISAKTTWDTLRMIWIDTYLGPPDFAVTDAGKNFTSKEFAQLASTVGTIVKSVPVEAHWSIGIVERYHAVIRRAYFIVKEELSDLSNEAALQMAVKAVNDTAGPDGLVPTLLVFGAYPRMVEYDPPAPTVAQRAATLKKAMSEVRKLHDERQVRDALNTRNGPSSTLVHRLPLNSDVLVWREGKTGYTGKWSGPYKLLGIDNETCTVELPRGPTEFRSTVVKPYLKNDNKPQDEDDDINDSQDDNEAEASTRANSPPPPSQSPPGTPTPGTRPQRKRRLPARYREDLLQSAIFAQFEQSRQKEINGLLENNVFEIVKLTNVSPGIRIFNSRFVDEIKNPGTDKAFEKSRLVVQAYNDEGKDLVLTQSPTIQRCSQRLLLCFAACVADAYLYIRDVTQAYVQSTTFLNRDFYIRPPPEIANTLPEGTILKVVRPLYGIPEAGNHWFRTYHGHHTEKLRMTTSTYDPCFLHCTDPAQGFGIVGMQTDDTLILADDAFANREENEIQRATILCKPRERLTATKSLKFNGGLISKAGQVITFTQERTCSLIRPVKEYNADTTSSRGKVRKDVSPHEQYVAQRALGAYIASVSQPEASFDLSYAAQITNLQKEDIKALNKRLQWQLDNGARGLRFVRLDLQSLRLVIFADSSFANNKDLSSQIGFVIVLADASNNANIIHWSSIKCKRITRSVLASELYAMTHGFDSAASIKSTVTQLLHLEKPLPLVVCTDSKSLYECLVKLGTTQEKRLMIDLMCLRQSYERQEITEVKWINGNSNPADAMTKSKPCRALQALVDTNKLHIDVDGWVERSPAHPAQPTAAPKVVKFASPLSTSIN